ncbi:hypothetical protein GWI33_011651, partial [Rhynchophorus ferrugineus]
QFSTPTHLYTEIKRLTRHDIKSSTLRGPGPLCYPINPKLVVGTSRRKITGPERLRAASPTRSDSWGVATGDEGKRLS